MAMINQDGVEHLVPKTGQAGDNLEFMARQLQTFAGPDPSAAKESRKGPDALGKLALKYSRDTNVDHLLAHHAHLDASEAYRQIGELDLAQAHKHMSEAHRIFHRAH